jgi:hypothetical protein
MDNSEIDELLCCAADSQDQLDWMKVVAFRCDDVVKAASKLRANVRSGLFGKLRKMFPDLHTASLVTRKIGTSAFGEDVYALATSFVERIYAPELNRCLKVDAAILSSIIDLRAGENC